ncbi:uncharacterized protein LOC123923231 [Trifolium pratense]|uniref:uncharacterized protein LOC123923231 n=1 Tax=Trifolium pratense TaxID=57577 RepID=UPI001E696504|nr:uncharacterized protein LOC123923231 [Trifolium pratense]XP_045831872.1 uncharacterized protein LOC123923231 [Trifolium pratense]
MFVIGRMDKSKTIAAEDVKPAKTEQDVKNPVPTDAPAKSIAVADKSEDANPGRMDKSKTIAAEDVKPAKGKCTRNVMSKKVKVDRNCLGGLDAANRYSAVSVKDDTNPKAAEEENVKDDTNPKAAEEEDGKYTNPKPKFDNDFGGDYDCHIC